MKKTVISIAVAAAAVLTGSAFAQNPVNCSSTTCTQTTKADARQAKKQPRVDPFAGLNLTAQQQQSIDALRAERSKACTASKEAKQQKQQAREERMNARKENRTAYLAKVKSILTPEQYVQYLENVYVNSVPNGHGDRRPAGHHGKRPARDSKAPRGNNAARS